MLYHVIPTECAKLSAQHNVYDIEREQGLPNLSQEALSHYSVPC